MWLYCWRHIVGNHIPSRCVSYFTQPDAPSDATSAARVKTKVQQRALAGIPPRGIFETFQRMLRGGDPNSPKPLLLGLTRLYQGLGIVSTQRGPFLYN